MEVLELTKPSWTTNTAAFDRASPLDWNWTHTTAVIECAAVGAAHDRGGAVDRSAAICKRLLLTRPPVRLRVWFVARIVPPPTFMICAPTLPPATAAIMPRLVMVPALSVRCSAARCCAGAIGDAAHRIPDGATRDVDASEICQLSADPECPIRPLNHATARVDNCRVDVATGDGGNRGHVGDRPPVNVPVLRRKICPVATLVMRQPP